MTARNPLYGATFAITNASAFTVSGSVIMIVSVSLYTYQAEQLLSMLTHSSSNKRVGDNVTVSGSAVYLMHLPKDVLTSVAAQDIHNSGFGSSPQYLSWGMLYDFFVAVVTLPYTLAVCAFNLAVSLAQAAVNLGLQIIGTLCALVASAVSAAETAVVNAFNAFVAWAIQFACDMFNALIAQPLQILKNEIVGWAMGLLSLIGTAVLTENNEGVSNASASLATYNFVINSDIFMILEFIGGALIAVLTTLMIMSGLGSEIVAITESALMKCLVSTIAGGLFSVAMFNGGVDVISGISQLLLGALGSDLSEGMAKVMGATMGTIGWLKSLVAAPILSNIVDFAIATIGFFLSYAGCLIHNQYWFGIDASLILDLFGLGFASYGVWDAFHMDDDAIEKIGVNGLSILKDVSLIEAGVSLFELTTTVTNDG